MCVEQRCSANTANLKLVRVYFGSFELGPTLLRLLIPMKGEFRVFRGKVNQYLRSDPE